MVMNRREAFNALRKAAGFHFGQVLPWYLILVGCILFPSRGLQILCDKISPTGYSWSQDAFRIGGFYISRWFLEDLVSMPEGTTFTIMKREHGAISVERVK